MHVHVRPLDVGDDRDIEASFQINAAAQALHVPDFPPYSRIDHVGQLNHPWPGTSSGSWLAVDDGDPLGALTVVPLTRRSPRRWARKPPCPR